MNQQKKLFQNFPSAENLCNKTDFFKIAELSKQSIISVGNDTGPMHIISRGNKPTLVFFTNNSNPNLCRQMGKKTFILNYKNDKNIFLDQIFREFKKVISN